MAEHDEFELALTKGSGIAPTGVQAMTGRYSQEVMGLIWMAKQFPRDKFAAHSKIIEACKRPTLAEKATYLFPRGKESITGPSIRLAEVLAQSWGNMSAGVMELEQKNGESTCLAFAWDLETNTRIEKMFTVKHKRDTKAGTKDLHDQRDIYELVANMGARRQRACILAIIPSDVVESATKQVEKTLKGSSKIPIADRIKAMLEAFVEFGVTKEMIEKRRGYGFDKFVEKDIAELKKIHNTLKDGMAKREDFFEVEGPAGKSEPSAEDEKLRAEFEKAQEAKKASAVQQTEMREVGEEG